MNRLLSLLALPLALTGCGSLLPKVDIVGSLDISGDRPENLEFTLYAQTKNAAAFDVEYCGDMDPGTCFGRVDVSKLDTPVTADDGSDLNVVVDGNNFTIEDVPLDLAYILVATGSGGDIVCSTDVIGFDEDTKVVTVDSAITISPDKGLDTFDLPRPVRLACSIPLDEPTAPDSPVEDEPAGDGEVTDSGDIGTSGDPTASWTAFSITGKGGSPVYGDASAANAQADVECGGLSFPSVLTVNATSTDTSATEAYLRIQFGSGEDATFRTVTVPMSGGNITQDISLTGGYAVVQLDTNADLDGSGESYTVSFCEPSTPPGQELLTILTWDVDDTDLDTHILSEGDEIAYYSMSRDWGDLDIDDTNGFGPETVTSTPETSGRNYEVQVHYYSDHGNGPATATMRVVYVDPSGAICDVTASQAMNSYDWWTVGAFGPGLACPN